MNIRTQIPSMLASFLVYGVEGMEFLRIILHLLGHDHADLAEERVMLARQQEALEQAPLEARVARRRRDS